ncbi:MAG TPA: Fe-S-containing protein [Thermodesulfobacteriota bacterium]|nr:Fe-S-containing protein [Thermodesulfobacteriota bacterium]
MKACQEHQTKVLNANGLSKRKTMSSRIFFLVAIVAVAIETAPIWILPGDTGAQPLAPSPPRASDKTEYWSKAIRMTDVSAKMENGKISIPLDFVKEKKIVRFEYEGNGVKIPLLSYITDGGNIVTAVSVCEPCRSTKFHIKDKLIVCNSCYTEWNLETLKGIKGGCLKYPPDVIPNKIDKGLILIDEKSVTQWKPRVVQK